MSTRNRLSKLTEEMLSQPSLPSPPGREGGGEKLETRFPPAAQIESDSSPTSSDAAPQPDVETRFPPALPRPRPRTGPGEMLAFRGQMLAAEGEVTKLREALARYGGSVPTRKLDPNSIRGSRWANRHADSFASADFLRLKSDIAESAGNVQPILVRPLSADSEKYEIVFGHRRHRACLELGLPVLAVIATEPMGDLELFVAMDRENRERADLSPWEQGTMYRRALDEGLYPSQRRLSESLGLSHTWVRKALMVADLPEPIVACFPSVLDIQHRHAEALTTALERDRRAVLRRAEKLRQAPPVSAIAAVQALLGKAGSVAQPMQLRVGDRVLGRVTWGSKGDVSVKLSAGSIPVASAGTLVRVLEDLLEQESRAMAAEPSREDGP